MMWIELLIGAIALITGLYYWSKSNFDFWSSRGVDGPSPLPFIGNTKDCWVVKTSFYELTKKIYDDYRDKSMIGIFLMREPALIITNLELIKDILVRDFTIFPDRGWRFFTNVEPMSQNLIHMEAARWRPLRPKLVPAFATGKFKTMFCVLLERGIDFDDTIDRFVDENQIVDCHELSARFTIDIVGHFLFGIKTNAMTNDKSEFRRIGMNAFLSNWKKAMKFRIRYAMPWLYSMLGPLMADTETNEFFVKLFADMIEHRKKNNIVKNDLFDILMDLHDHPEQITEYELTDTLITAQLFVFFLAGFETSAVTMSHVLYEIAQNQTIQNKIRDEINSELSRNNGELTYEGFNSMKYLDMVLQEALRKYPPVSILTRKSAENYTFANKVTIPKGTKIIIPVFAIQRDSQNYPKPDVFDPERFTDEAVKARHLMTDLAFGQGPRMCIGRRYANYQSKFGLLKILQRYKVQVCEKTQIPYIIEPTNIVLSMKNGPYLKLSKIN